MSDLEFGPHPEFSWSRSRHDTFSVCARRYYYRYYGSWRGWEDDAGPRTKRAYLLKQLTSLPAELGRAVHRRAFEVGFRAAQGLPLPSLGDLVGRTRDELNDVVRSSRDRGSFRRRPARRSFLRRAWYGEPLTGEVVDATEERLEASHRALRAHEIWDAVREEELEVDFLGDPEVVPDPQLRVDGVPVYGEPDLVLRPAGERPPVVLDWKSGRERDGDLWQLAVHGLWVRATRGDPVCVGRVEYLAEDTAHEVELGEGELDAAEARIRESLGEMRALLEDPDRNEARSRDAFPLTEHTRVCRWCDFFELCEDELRERGELPPER